MAHFVPLDSVNNMHYWSWPRRVLSAPKARGLPLSLDYLLKRHLYWQGLHESEHSLPIVNDNVTEQVFMIKPT